MLDIKTLWEYTYLDKDEVIFLSSGGRNVAYPMEGKKQKAAYGGRMGVSVKNKPDGLFFIQLFVPRTSQIAGELCSPYPTGKTAYADFSCGSSNAYVLGMEE